MPETKPKPKFAFSVTPFDKDGVRTYQFERGPSVLVEYVSDEPVENFLVRLCEFMNRDRRDILYVEDKVISLQKLIENCLALLEILHARLSTCAGVKYKQQVAEWVAKSKELQEKIRKESELNGINGK